jgi:predicted  nucleic acid-binding Zn-ribbon protein
MTIDELVYNMIQGYIHDTEYKMTESLDIKADAAVFEKHLNKIRDRVDNLEYQVGHLKSNETSFKNHTSDIITLRADTHNLRRDVNAIRSALDALTEKPKQKSLLEIFKEKDEINTILSLTNNPFLKGE